MITISFCELERHADTGVRYVMVRLASGDPHLVKAEWQWRRDEWLGFLQLLKPSRSLEVNEIQLQDWRK